MKLEQYFSAIYGLIIFWPLQVILFFDNSIITVMGERFKPWLAGSPNKGE